MEKIKNEYLCNVCGGYITIITNFETGEAIANVHDNTTNEIIISQKLFGEQAKHLRAPLDSETIETLRILDEEFNGNICP